MYICHIVGLFDMFYHIVLLRNCSHFLKTKAQGTNHVLFGCVNQVKVFIFIKSQLRVLSVVH